MKTITQFLTVLFFLAHFNIYAQTLQQTIRGKVLDKNSQATLPGAHIVIKGTNPVLAASTDIDGNFRIPEVPVGRYTLEVTYIGYSPAVLPEVLAGSGKEVVLTIELTELVNKLDEVVIKSHVNKDKPLNNMAAVSARSFNVEETRRYAGGIDDPARLATAYAGVSAGGNKQDNAIVVRGNAPKTVLWRVEGVDIPNPNHFSGGNVAGGGMVTTISSQMLANSDFYTGAFPAEYGNALGGVFDIKLRTGNNEKREYAVQAGLMGLDFSGEGPFNKPGRASYLFNYRYSTFGLLSNLGVIPSDQTPKYQDLSFRLFFPTKKAGVFSLWGLGGTDRLSDAEQRDSLQWETEWDRYTCKWDEAFGAVGLNNKYRINNRMLISTSLVATADFKKLTQQRLDDALTLQNDMDLRNNSGKLSLNMYVNYKLNARLTTRTGFNFNSLFYNFNLSGTANDMPGTFTKYADDAGRSFHAQIYSEAKYYLSEALSLNGGIQTEYFALSGKFSADPRLSLTWDFASAHSLSIGYGKHSQMEDLNVYFIKELGSNLYPNKKLDFAHARHFVLGYNYKINDHLRLMIETYYQQLYHIPGIADSSFSMINFKQDLTFQAALANNSEGRNYGVDITLERFLKNNFYYLVTTSIFDSKYKADDHIWRDTRYNKNFVANVLFGKEFFTGKSKTNLLGMNLRINISGGERYTPLDETASLAVKRPITNDYLSFSKQDPVSKFLDITFTYRINKARHSSVWALQLNNALGEAQYDKYEYNYKKQVFERAAKVYTLPVISYKLEF